MMIVEFFPAAELELDEAVAYYDLKKAGLGTEFACDIQAAIHAISERPQAWKPLRRSIRLYLLKRFQYGLVYRVAGNVATVYAVMHLKRRPGYWRTRLKAGGT